MDKQDRQAALSAYRERKVTAGVFALRCEGEEQCWIGRASDLGTIWNRLSFTLRQHSHPHPSLQNAWDRYGPDAFRFEVLEELDDEEAIPFGREQELKKRHQFWLEKGDALRL